jgi:hypothetical protein
MANNFLGWGTLFFTGVGGTLAAFAPVYPTPNATTVLAAGAASAAIWAGLFQHPPWAAQPAPVVAPLIAPAPAPVVLNPAP